MKKLKINFQRFGVLFLSLMIACSSVVCIAVPAIATSYDDIELNEPVGILIDHNVSVPIFESGYIPIFGYASIIWNGEICVVECDQIDIVGDGTRWTISVMLPGQRVPNDFVIVNDSVFTSNFLYLYVDGSIVSDMDSVRFMDSFGTLIQFKDSYIYREDLFFPSSFVVSDINISTGSFVSGIYNFDSVTLTPVYNSRGGYDFMLQYLSFNPVRNIVAYSSETGWSSDLYRFMSFDYFVPKDYSLAIFMLHNEAGASVFDRLTSGFTAAIGWMGDLLTSLLTTNGALILAFVLISVGFGLGLLGKGFRWLRGLLFGY